MSSLNFYMLPYWKDALEANESIDLWRCEPNRISDVAMKISCNGPAKLTSPILWDNLSDNSSDRSKSVILDVSSVDTATKTLSFVSPFLEIVDPMVENGAARMRRGTRVSLNRGGNRLLSSYESGVCLLVDLPNESVTSSEFASSKGYVRLMGHNADVTAVGWFPSDIVTFSSALDMTFRIWDARNGPATFPESESSKDPLTSTGFVERDPSFTFSLTSTSALLDVLPVDTGRTVVCAYQNGVLTLFKLAGEETLFTTKFSPKLSRGSSVFSGSSVVRETGSNEFSSYWYCAVPIPSVGEGNSALIKILRISESSMEVFHSLVCRSVTSIIALRACTSSSIEQTSSFQMVSVASSGEVFVHNVPFTSSTSSEDYLEASQSFSAPRVADGLEVSSAVVMDTRLLTGAACAPSATFTESLRFILGFNDGQCLIYRTSSTNGANCMIQTCQLTGSDSDTIRDISVALTADTASRLGNDSIDDDLGSLISANPLLSIATSANDGKARIYRIPYSILRQAFL